jgi:hypothetical protein
VINLISISKPLNSNFESNIIEGIKTSEFNKYIQQAMQLKEKQL